MMNWMMVMAQPEEQFIQDEFNEDIEGVVPFLAFASGVFGVLHSAWEFLPAQVARFYLHENLSGVRHAVLL